MQKRKIRIVKIIVSLLLLETVLGLSGCAKAQNIDVSTNSSDGLLPGFDELIEKDNEIEKKAADPEKDNYSLKIFFDNTGSLEGFTIDGNGIKNPDDMYIRLIRCLRDTGLKHGRQYYILDGDKLEWCEYEEELYDHFSEKNFFIYWGDKKQGPLSKLCKDNKMDTSCVNIILTELAEQSVNNTELAGEIREMCENENFTADLYAFKFDFNAPTQVPNPDRVSEMMEEVIHDKRPYYMIVAGPSDYMERYRMELQGFMEKEEMKKNIDYFTMTSAVDIECNSITLEDVVFESFASYEEITGDGNSKKQENEEKEDEESERDQTVSLREKSKNLAPCEHTGKLFKDKSETDFRAFSYKKVDGIADKYGDWNLSFYVPLKDWGSPQTEYSYDCRIYYPELAESETGEQIEELGKWAEDEEAGIEYKMEVLENFKDEDNEYPAVLYVACKERTVESSHAADRHEQLLILKVMEEKVYACEQPDWLEDFDSGNTGEYFTRTYNLDKFCDVLFGNKEGESEDGMIHVKKNYVQVPILLTELGD